GPVTGWPPTSPRQSITPVSPPEVNCPKDDTREIGWSSVTTQSAVQTRGRPDGTDGGAAGTTIGGRAGTGTAAPAATGRARSARQTTSVDPPRPTAGCYRRGPPAAPGWPGQSRPAGASQAQSRREDSVTPNWLNQTKLTSGFQGNPQLRFRFMAIATRRLQAPAAPPLCPGDRSAGGLRRPGPAGAPPRPDSRDAHRRVVEAALETGDVAATVEAVADLTGAAAVLQDRFLAVLASAPPPDGEADPTGIALSRAGAPLVRELLRDGSGRPALVELPRHGCTPARLVARVTARGELLGFLVTGAVDRAAYATLEAAAPLVALLLQAEERLCRLLGRDQRELFLDLLAGRSADCL